MDEDHTFANSVRFTLNQELVIPPTLITSLSIPSLASFYFFIPPKCYAFQVSVCCFIYHYMIKHAILLGKKCSINQFIYSSKVESSRDNNKGYEKISVAISVHELP
jgi:hypothetical protein